MGNAGLGNSNDLSACNSGNLLKSIQIDILVEKVHRAIAMQKEGAAIMIAAKVAGRMCAAIYAATAVAQAWG